MSHCDVLYRFYEAVAGIIWEDQEWPKKCGHFEGKRVIPMAEHIEKIKAGVHARGDSGLVIKLSCI